MRFPFSYILIRIFGYTFQLHSRMYRWWNCFTRLDRAAKHSMGRVLSSTAFWPVPGWWNVGGIRVVFNDRASRLDLSKRFQILARKHDSTKCSVRLNRLSQMNEFSIFDGLVLIRRQWPCFDSAKAIIVSYWKLMTPQENPITTRAIQMSIFVLLLSWYIMEIVVSLCLSLKLTINHTLLHD